MREWLHSPGSGPSGGSALGSGGGFCPAGCGCRCLHAAPPAVEEESTDDAHASSPNSRSPRTSLVASRDASVHGSGGGAMQRGARGLPPRAQRARADSASADGSGRARARFGGAPGTAPSAADSWLSHVASGDLGSLLRSNTTPGRTRRALSK